MRYKYAYISLISVLMLVFVGLKPASAQQMEFADLEYPYPVEYQELQNGQRVAYVDQGEGMPLILIHGLGSYIPAWKKNLPALSESYRVIALDLPGFGKSSKNVNKYSISFFAETVMQLQDALGIDQAVWVGHSMGAQIAMQAALLYPNQVTKLVLISPAGFETFTQQEGSLMKQFVTPASIKATPDSLIRQTFRTTFYDFPEEAAFMAEDRVSIRHAEDFDLYAKAYASSVQAMLEGPVFEKLPEITQPALILFGKQDALIPNRQFHPNLTTRKVAQNGADKIPNSTLQMVDKAGHFVHFEQSNSVNKAIENFLNQ